jgi:hypothetical protein
MPRTVHLRAVLGPKVQLRIDAPQRTAITTAAKRMVGASSPAASFTMGGGGADKPVSVRGLQTTPVARRAALILAARLAARAPGQCPLRSESDRRAALPQSVAMGQSRTNQHLGHSHDYVCLNFGSNLAAAMSIRNR